MQLLKAKVTLSFTLSLCLSFSLSLVLSFSRSLLLSFANYLFLSKFLSLSFLLIPPLPSSFTVSSIFCSSLFVSILIYNVIVYLCFLIDWPFCLFRLSLRIDHPHSYIEHFKSFSPLYSHVGLLHYSFFFFPFLIHCLSFSFPILYIHKGTQEL